MIFNPLPIAGAYLIQAELFSDARGSFARTFCQRESDDLAFEIKQCNISCNTHKGTLRGMHYQKQPHLEIKLVSCLQGRAYDVMIDLRRDSPSYLQWFAMELDNEGHTLIYIPPMVAHGFQTLEDNTVMYYQLGEFFVPEAYAGVRYDDPAFGVQWPLEISMISEKDKSYERFLL